MYTLDCSDETEARIRLLPHGRSPLLANLKQMLPRLTRRFAVLITGLSSLVVSASAQTNTEDSEEEKELVELSPFTVSSDAGQGYGATHAIGATRTSFAIKDIAQTVVVLTDDFMNDVAPGETYDALKYVSGVSVASNSGDNFTIRGYTLGGAFADGLPDLQNQSNIGTEPFMYERLEVFKGPSALVYGSHSPGGVINRVRKAADLSRKPGGTVGGLLGDYGQMRAYLDYNNHLGENFAYRLVGMWRDEDLIQGVPTKFAFTNRINFNPSIAWKINDRAQLKIVGEYRDEAHFKNWSEAFALQPFGTNGPTTFSERLLPRDFTISDSSGRNDNTKFGYFASLELSLSENWQMRLLNVLSTWDHDVNDWVPNGIDADNRTMPRRHRLTINDDFATSFAIDTVFSFDTGSVNHKVVMLGQYNNSRGDNYWVQDANLFPLDIYEPDYFQSSTGGLENFDNPLGLDFDPDIIDTFVEPVNNRARTSYGDVWSLSAQDQIRFANDRIQVVGGIRYDTYSTQTNDHLAGEEGEVGRGDNYTYKFGVIGDVVEGLTLYYNYSETFAPNFGTQPDGTQFKPLEGVINEVGAKASLLDGRISGTLAVFRIEQTNLIQNDPDPLRAADGWRVQTEFNQVEGIELDMVAKLAADWEVMVSGSLLDIHQPNGLVPRGVSEESAAFWTRYNFSKGALKGLAIGGGVSWLGPTALESGNNYFGQDTAVVDVFASYIWNDVRFQLNVANLTDEWYLQRGVNRTILFQGPVRHFKFSAEYSF